MLLNSLTPEISTLSVINTTSYLSNRCSMAQNTNSSFKIIAGADSFGCALKDALVAHLRSLDIDVEDIGTDKYYSVGEEIGRRVSSVATAAAYSPNEIRGLVACGTGVGVSIFANKFPGVYAATCLTPSDALNARSINNCNVIAVSGMSTSPDSAIEILNTWLNTPFKSPCPASGSNPWPPEIESFLDQSINEMPKIGSSPASNLQIAQESKQQSPAGDDPILGDSCAICNHAKSREFVPVDIMPGASMSVVRDLPTSAIVRFKAGSMEPGHHHTFGHDVVVLKGKKSVWNVSKGEKYNLGVGDFLYTPAGDVHRVKYWEDTEFFIKWDGKWDILLDEDLAAANAAVEKENRFAA